MGKKRNMWVKLEGGLQIATKLIDEPTVAARSSFDTEKMEELVESIRTVGIIEPLVIMKKGSRFEVIAGDRRLRAAKKAGLSEVPCVVADPTGGKGEMMKLHENLVREDLNVLDEARFLQITMQRQKLNTAQLARLLGRSDGYVSQRLDALKWEEWLVKPLRDGKMVFSVARELCRMKNKDLQREYARHAVNGGISPSLAKQWVDDAIALERAQKGETEEKVGRGRPQRVDEYMFPCQICSVPKKVSDTTMWRICHGCAKESKLA